ncbi:MAG: aldo/keto reductase, partial [Devosia sp.]
MTSINAIPAMGFGTFDRREEAGIRAIQYALELGYRHLDTAQSYDTERECGEALRRSGLKRSDVFLTTKVTGANCAAGQLIPSL